MKTIEKSSNLSQLLIDIHKTDVNIIPINLSDVMSAWKKYIKVCKSEQNHKELVLNY